MLTFSITQATIILLSIAALAVHAITIPGYAIRASSKGRFWETQDGEPFFWQADTAWLLFHRLNLSQIETYLDDRASKGFNMVLVVAVTQEG